MSKRIFITGGANGIGKALVQAFSAEGHQVAFCDDDVNKGSQLAAETNTIPVRNFLQLKELIRKVGDECN